MTTYTIDTARERYSVDANGNIGRPSIRMEPSGMWTVHGAARYNNFGNRTAFMRFPECMKICDWRHDNGKSKWRLIDYDHGTMRQWGETVISTNEVIT
jgi:hypothetical protein